MAEVTAYGSVEPATTLMGVPAGAGWALLGMGTSAVGVSCVAEPGNVLALSAQGLQ